MPLSLRGFFSLVRSRQERYPDSTNPNSQFSMPSAIKTRCRFPGCNRAVRDRFCDEHRRATWRAADARRATPAERGYDARWRRLRAWYIRQHPLCEDCLEEGIVCATAIEVDHILPISVRADMRLDASNLRSRCHMHHRRKTLQDEKKYSVSAVT